MSHNNRIVILYLCQELLKHKIVAEPIINSIRQKLLTSESCNVYDKKSA